MASAILLTLLASLLNLSKNQTTLDFIQRLEAIPYDIRLKLSTPIKINEIPPIVIIDIDEGSLKTDGRWPWSRKKLAQLVKKLSLNNTALIMLDVVQSEKEINPIDKIRNSLAKINKLIPSWFSQIEKDLDADSYFSEALNNKEIVLGFPFHATLTTQTGTLSQSTIEVDTTKTNLLTTFEMQGYTANLEVFLNNSRGSGFINITSEADGIIRRAPVILSFNNKIYPSLALEAARIYYLEDTIKLHSASIGNVRTITHLSLGKSIIPTDAQGRILIPYLGRKKHFPYISASKLLHSDKPFPELENAIAIIGTSAITLADLRTTPVQANFPGVEIQANILHGILNPQSISRIPDWTHGATIVSLVILCILMILVYPMLQPLSLVISGTTLLFIMFSFNYWLWASQKISLPIVMSILLIITVSSIYIIYDLLKENKDRRRIHEMFGQYVPLGHINKLIDSPKEISTDGEKREMTVLFSDIRNFTSLSEPLSTGELKSFLNLYLTPITKIIFDNQGTIDKYVGDMVMAFWGAPIHDLQHANHAVISALEIQQKITDMQNDFARIGIDHITAGIGIHTGEMNVGDMGSDYRRAYTVLGDAVNLGSRLENLTKFYGVKILASEDTKNQCPEIIFQYIDHVRVKGKKDAIKIYQPVFIKTHITKSQKELLDLHEQAFKAYLDGDWEEASMLLNILLDKTNQTIYQLYLDRIDTFSQSPPENWDTIYTHISK